MRRPTALSVPLAVIVVALAACGSGDTKIDSGKAEGLARKVGNSGTIKLKSASCPSDVTAKKGGTFDCDLVYADGAKGTITIHMTDDNGQIRTSGADIKVKPA